MLFIPLWQIKENSKSNCDFLKGIISTVSNWNYVGITCLGLFFKKKNKYTTGVLWVMKESILVLAVTCQLVLADWALG